ncbi:MAG: protein kinase domain-containing protein [Acidobacteriota bacterium]
MLAPETILQGRYRIVRQLGQGGMGAVYESVDLRLDTVVALKETLFTEERLRKQFEREARLLARLHHQALPRVSDHFTENEGAFLVMQYIPGEDLFEMQGRRGSGFPQADVLQWADQLCDALDYLHTQDPQIIHRDIKPQNLKLTARGQIVLLDFGLAKGSGGQMSVVTTSASIFGYTPNYAPLEQVQGLGTDPRSDIYSLAATLYHMVTNVKPPDALSRASAIVNGLEDPLAPADSVSPNVSRAVAQVLQTAMSQKRDDRYESAETMREALRSASTRALGEMPTVLTSAGATTRADTVAPASGTRMVGQHTQPGGNEAQTLLADDATKVRSQSAGAVAAAPATGHRRSQWLLAAAVVMMIVIIAGGTTVFLIHRARQSGSAASLPTPTPSPAAEGAPITNTSASEARPTVEEPKDVNPNADADKRVKQTSATKPVVNPTPEVANERDAGHDPNRRSPEPPLIDFGPSPERRPRPTPPPVQTFPNGTRVERRADGSTVVTFPDGRTRVFPPGTRPNNPRRRPGRP